MSVNPAVRELFSAKVLENFKKGLHWKLGTNSNYEGDIKGKGSVLRILSVPRPTRSNITVGSNITYERLRPTAQSFIIDQDVGWNIAEDDLEQKLQSIPLMEQLAREGAYVLADGVDQYLALQAARQAATTVTAEIVGNGAGDTKAYDVLVRHARKMNELQVPEDGRHTYIPFWFMELLRLDPRFTGFGTSESRATIRGTVIDKIEGMMIHATLNIPGLTDTSIASATATSATIISTNEIATTYGEHIPPEGQVETFSGSENVLNHDALMRARHVFGAAVVHPDGIVKQQVTLGS